MRLKKAVMIPVLSLCIVLLLAGTALAGTIRVGSRNVTDYFEYHNSSGWHNLDTPEHYIVGTNEVAYCLEHKRSCPHSSSYSDSDILDNYSSRTRRGLQIILENGYPYATGGLSAAKARYATANAIRFWLSEQRESQCYNFTNFGAYSNAQLRSYAASGTIGSKIRAKSGQTTVLQHAIELLILARSQTLMAHDISFSPMNMHISGGYFVGTTRVTLNNMNRGYTLSTGGLPYGSAVSGYTGSNGDVLSIRIPLSSGNSDRNFTISATGYDNRMRANMAAYDAYYSSIQAVVTVVTGPSTAARTTHLTMHTPALPDLIVSSLRTDKSSYEAGDTVRVTATVRNQGNSSAGAFYVSLSPSGLPTQTKAVSTLRAGASRSIAFSFTAPTYTNTRNVRLTVTADSSNSVIEMNESNNSRSVYTVIQGAKPDLVISNLMTDKGTYDADETVTVTAQIRNQGNRDAGSCKITLSSDSIDDITKTVGPIAVGKTATVMFTFSAPALADETIVEIVAEADSDNDIAESDESNNTRTTAFGVNAIRPDITIVGSTVTDWYAGMDVTVSAVVQNLTAQPVLSVAVRLQVGNSTYTERIPVAGNGSNLAVFRITVPAAGDYTAVFTADSDHLIEEIDEGNNVWSSGVSVLDVPISVVMDPDDNDMARQYRTHGLHDLPSLSESKYHSWQEVRLENGNYVTKHYWARLTTTFELLPDSRIAYSDNPTMMESGFGVQAACITTLTTNYDNPDKLVGIQMVWVRYPESGYGQVTEWQSVWDSLAVKQGQVGEKKITWQYRVNSYSVLGKRLHYTSLWFPDGVYTAWAQAFYAWSPVGQLYDNETSDVVIDGDMYDRITTTRR